jgi:hypothetical protein
MVASEKLPRLTTRGGSSSPPGSSGSAQAQHRAALQQPSGASRCGRVYRCAGCDGALFPAKARFDSGTGWPSFTESGPGGVELHRDFRAGIPRTEVVCRRCGGAPQAPSSVTGRGRQASGTASTGVPSGAAAVSPVGGRKRLGEGRAEAETGHRLRGPDTRTKPSSRSTHPSQAKARSPQNVRGPAQPGRPETPRASAWTGRLSAAREN